MKLPYKPAAVARVTDAHWEAALRHAWSIFASKRPSTIDFEVVYWGVAEITPTIIDHARCLILLNEVPDPVDPLDAAIDAAWADWLAYAEDPMLEEHFAAVIHRHLAGITIPEAGQ
jgi:hypothetical protein